MPFHGRPYLILSSTGACLSQDAKQHHLKPYDYICKMATVQLDDGSQSLHQKKCCFKVVSPNLVGGFNPFEKCSSNWIISPGMKIKHVWNHYLEPSIKKMLENGVPGNYLATTSPRIPTPHHQDDGKTHFDMRRLYPQIGKQHSNMAMFEVTFLLLVCIMKWSFCLLSQFRTMKCKSSKSIFSYDVMPKNWKVSHWIIDRISFCWEDWEVS